MTIRLSGGPHDGKVFPAGERSRFFTVTEVSVSDDPDTIDAQRSRYADTQNADPDGRRIFQYQGKEIEQEITHTVHPTPTVGNQP